MAAEHQLSVTEGAFLKNTAFRGAVFGTQKGHVFCTRTLQEVRKPRWVGSGEGQRGPHLQPLAAAKLVASRSCRGPASLTPWSACHYESVLCSSSAVRLFVCFPWWPTPVAADVFGRMLSSCMFASGPHCFKSVRAFVSSDVVTHKALPVPV